MKHLKHLIDKQVSKLTVGLDNKARREVWLEAALKSIPKGKKILDAGAGELQYKKFCTHLDYVSQDFGGYDGQGTGEGLQTESWDNSKLDIISDIIDMPIDDKSFDAIMCIEVFEHIEQPALAVKEFARVIKPGGTLIITAPFASLTHFAPYFFGNGYSKYWYEKILGDNGFEIQEMDFNSNYFGYVAQEVRRIPEVAKLYVNKDWKPGLKYKLASWIMLKTLQLLNDKDTKSNEFACMGVHVLAKKVK